LVTALATVRSDLSNAMIQAVNDVLGLTQTTRWRIWSADLKKTHWST